MARYDTVTQAAIDHLIKGSCRSNPIGRFLSLQEAIEAKHPGALARAKVRRAKETFEAKFVGPVPAWAKAYVAKYGSVSSLTVRQSRTKTYSSGHCRYGNRRLVVTLSKTGSALVEQQAVMLHEIAHTVALYDGHGDRFYTEWYQMLRDEGIYRATIATGRFVGVGSLKAAARRTRAIRPLTKAS